MSKNEKHPVWTSGTREWSRLKLRARLFRKESTHAERVLWGHLRARRLKGYKFRRQQAIDRFIADFYCFQAKLIVEIDGPIHNKQKDRDAARQERLELLGYTVIRFSNQQVLENLDLVLSKIGETIESLL